MAKLTHHTSSKKNRIRQLTEQTTSPLGKVPRLLAPDDRTSLRFKLALPELLQAPYTFEKMKVGDIREFSIFLKKTVGKNLTISQVEALYLRKDGPHGAKNKEKIHDEDRLTVHFDNGKRDFRIHGYYDELGYFCVCRIDPHHRYNF
ncbi:MAG: hypothetical protein LKH74_02670 [Levilactobacillus sp.]|nr:hypothetical protein [Levilactobacillus sp.]MCH4123047.1 hypothetical protein [Levilactobacillus sp.]MCI1552815.1 hypothetical protein [Levilactobacillus sp.]MCI1598904.1 hypothetical protein [Levilactobacillus sp.]MCI1605501.1 hypothetical protein [Levilactobacillus sp.]